MSQIVLTPELLTTLPTIKEEITIIDERGKVLGFYQPIDYGKLFPNVSEEDRYRIRQENEWVTTDELLAYLKKR